MTKVTQKIWAVILAALMMVTVFGALVMTTGSTTAKAATPIEETLVVKQAKDKNWYTFKKGSNKIYTNYTGIAKNSNGWWRVVKGKVNFKANGVFSNSYGNWWVENGKVNFDKNDTVTYNKKTYVIRDGKATLEKDYKYKQYDCNDLTVKQAPDGNWYAFDGNTIAWDYTGIAPNGNGWWRIVRGRLDWNATGVFSNNNGEFYVEKGKVNFAKYGVVNANGKTYTIVAGQVASSANNGYSTNYDSSKLVVKGSGNNWYAYNGNKIAWDYTGIAPNENGWWRVENGKVNFSANGIYQNEKGLWKVTNGKVDFGYTGPFADSIGNVYTIVSGLVQN